MRLPTYAAAAAALAAALCVASCVEVTEPPCPPIVIPEGTGTDDSFCECASADVTGRVFRVTRLEIDEPDAFAEILNLLWENDIVNNVLNVLVFVDSAKQGTAAAFDELRIVVGPGWRHPKMPYVLKAEDGEPSETAVDSYCLLTGLSEEISLEPYHGYQCQFKSTAPSALYFHSGPKDGPLVCAPDNSPPNNIPISDLKIRTSLNRDCTAIHDGFLEGCITVAAADRICMCMADAGECPREPDPDYEFDQDDLIGSCRGACGDTWLSFGEIVRSFGLLPSCLTPEGDEGYGVQAFFDATVVTDRFDPISSDDCAPGADPGR